MWWPPAPPFRRRSGHNAETVEAMGPGGVSGAPVQDRATEVVRHLAAKSRSIPIIGVGGSIVEAAQRDAGCGSVIYQGPVAGSIGAGLAEPQVQG